MTTVDWGNYRIPVDMEIVSDFHSKLVDFR
jgi:hypothetical protein